jgi:lysophospholipase L1-like esterase
MKRILCYGDSNTWGWDPKTAGRYPSNVRWPGVMAAALGPGFEILEEGLNGRTTVFDDPTNDGRNGRPYLVPCLESHRPLDLVIVFLGVNDLKARFGLSPVDIADGASVLVKIIQASDAGPVTEGGMPPPPVLLIAPPPTGRLTDFAELFTGATEKSRGLGAAYARVARERSCAFLDAGEHIASSDVDGIHFDPGAHAKLGAVVAAKVLEILGEKIGGES